MDIATDVPNQKIDITTIINKAL